MNFYSIIFCEYVSSADSNLRRSVCFIGASAVYTPFPNAAIEKKNRMLIKMGVQYNRLS